MRNASDDPSTTVVHRPFGGIDGYRCVTDRASRVVVHAFPLPFLPSVVAAGLLSTPGAYVLLGDETAYVGESLRPARRLADHSTDPAKGFARDVVVVAGDGAAFDKGLILDLQHRLARRIQDSGARSIAGAFPAEIEMAPADRATSDRIFADACRLIFDGGHRILNTAEARGQDVEARASLAVDDSESDDAGPISINVSTTPMGMTEYELRYDAIWARGYWAGDDKFIVAAGSEARTQTNPSCDPHTRARREDLLASGVLAPIPGVDDRRRLVAAVAFPSASIAAKCCCGAHTAGRWAPLDRSAVVVLGGLRQAS